MARRSIARGTQPPDGGLAALLATEALVRDDLASARGEAAAIIAAARRRAGSAAAAELAAPPLASEVDAELELDLREIEETLACQLAAHQAALDRRLDELADAVVAALLAGVAGESA